MKKQTYTFKISDDRSHIETQVEARSYTEAVALLLAELIGQDLEPDDEGPPQFDFSRAAGLTP